MSKKKVVIIGGGFVGASVARQLQKEDRFSVTLIDNKHYFEFTPSILRAVIEPEHLDKITVPHKKYLAHGKFVLGNAKEITPKYVLVDKKKIPYDYLVISSGSTHSLFAADKNMIMASRSHSLIHSYEKLQKVKNITIIGGGLVGVELAAEIATFYKNSDKEIMLIHGKDKLCERNNSKTSKYVEKFLKKNGVKIVFNEMVSKVDKREIVTQSGKRIPSDLTFMCIGMVPSTDFVKKHFSVAVLKDRWINVNPGLQLEDGETSNIFVGGDIAGIMEEKTAQSAEKHADVIVANIKHVECDERLEEYVSKKWPMVISLGKYNAVFEYKGFVLTGIVPAFIKKWVEFKSMLKYR